MRLVQFTLDDNSPLWINPSNVDAVQRNKENKNYTDIDSAGRRYTVAEHVEAVVNLIDIWLT